MAANLGQAIANAGKVDAELTSQYMDLMDIVGTTMAENVKAQESIVVDGQLVSPTIVRMKNAEMLKTEATKTGLAAAAGFSPDMNADIRSILISDLRENAMKMRTTAAKLQQDKSVSLFEDPGLAILNSFTIPFDEMELEGLTTQRDQLSNSLTAITSGVTNSAAAAKALEAKVTFASAQEEQRLVEAELVRQRKVGEISVLKHNMEEVKFAMEANGRVFQRMVAQDEWINREENREIMRLQKKSMIARQKEEEKKVADEKALQLHLMELANAALAEAGRPQFKSPGEMAFYMQTAKGKQAIDSLVDDGRALLDPVLSQFHRYGDTVQETVQKLDAIGIQGTTPDQKRLIKIVRKAAADAAAGTKDKDGKAVTAERLVQERITELEYVEKGDETNPLRALTFGSMLQQSEIQKQKAFPILAEMVTDGNRQLSAHPADVFPVLAKAVLERKISPDDSARLLNAMYSASAAVTSRDIKLHRITGMTQTRFVADIEGMPISTATGAGAFLTPIAVGLAAAGAGLPAGAAVGAAGVGLTVMGAASDHAAGRGVNFKDFNETRNLMVRYVAAKVGMKLNIDKPTPGGTAMYDAPFLIPGNE